MQAELEKLQNGSSKSSSFKMERPIDDIITTSEGKDKTAAADDEVAQGADSSS